MTRVQRMLINIFIAIGLLIGTFSLDASLNRTTNQSYLHIEAQAQFADDFWRFISKIAPSTSRRLSREAKGEIGEENIENSLRLLGRNMDEVFEVERIYLKKGALDHGFDGLYYGIKRQRFNVIEAKATTNTKMLYEGILGNTSVGREMDTKWMRHSLQNAEDQAWRIINDETADAAQKQAARQILGTIEEVRIRTFRRTDRTLVVTRLLGVDETPGVGRSIHTNLAKYFDNIIEVDRNGRVIPGGVYAGLRR